jgi:hypothetical protein
MTLYYVIRCTIMPVWLKGSRISLHAYAAACEVQHVAEAVASHTDPLHDRCFLQLRDG